MNRRRSISRLPAATATTRRSQVDRGETADRRIVVPRAGRRGGCARPRKSLQSAGCGRLRSLIDPIGGRRTSMVNGAEYFMAPGSTLEDGPQEISLASTWPRRGETAPPVRSGASGPPRSAQISSPLPIGALFPFGETRRDGRFGRSRRRREGGAVELSAWPSPSAAWPLSPARREPGRLVRRTRCRRPICRSGRRLAPLGRPREGRAGSRA